MSNEFRLLTVIVIVFSLVFFIVSGEKATAEQRNAEEHQERVAAQLQEAHKRLAGMVYIKDPQTGLCFGSSWGGFGNGGPVFTNVPCEAVAHLLK